VVAACVAEKFPLRFEHLWLPGRSASLPPNSTLSSAHLSARRLHLFVVESSRRSTTRHKLVSLLLSSLSSHRVGLNPPTVALSSVGSVRSSAFPVPQFKLLSA
jgi:hypothetical protein